MGSRYDRRMQTSAERTDSPPVRRHATYADVLSAPAHLTAELIAGELFLMPRPRVRHSVTHTAIVIDLGESFGRRRPRVGPGGWHILLEQELHLGGPADPTSLVLVPDVAGWRRERMPEPPDTAGIELPPDWTCEILSPGTERHDRFRKMDHYARAGVSWVWLVDPVAHAIEVYQLDGATYRFLGGVLAEATARLPPFDAVELDLAEWWIAPEPEMVAP